MKRAITAIVLLLATALPLMGRDDESALVPPLKIEQAQEGVGSEFGAGARLLYHDLDTERLPGLEEWIVEAPAFELSKQPLSKPVIDMQDTGPVRAMISIRLPKLPLNDAIRSLRGRWKSPDGKVIVCDVLYTRTTRFVFLLKEP